MDMTRTLHKTLPAEPARKARNNAGMTLLELMIAAGVMTIGFVLLFGSIMSISTTGSSSEDRAIAVAHVSTVIEELRSLDFTDVLEYQPPPITGLGGSALFIVELIESDEEGVTVLGTLPNTISALAAPPPNPAEVRVRLQWRDDYGRPRRALATVQLAR